MKRIIFLDIDGVFNCVGSMLAFGSPKLFDEVALRLMARLCVQTNAHVVMSSAWRQGKDLDGLRRIFRRRGALDIASRIIDKTPHLLGVRGEEIAHWLTHNEYDSFIIIDDDADMLAEQMPRFVHTSSLTGFRFPEYVAALALFEPEHRDLLCVKGYRVRTLEWPAEEAVTP